MAKFGDGFRRLVAYAGLGLGSTLLKDFGVTWDGDYGWTSVGSRSRMPARYPGSDLNWGQEVGNIWLNSVASLCLQYIFDKVIEPRVHVVSEDDEGMLQPVDGHPCADLLMRPNPEYHGNALLGGLALSYKVSGNAYAVKVRGGLGRVVELWYVPHWQMFPLDEKDGGPTKFYVYSRPMASGGMQKRVIARADVIHLRNHIDPEYPRLGYDQFRAQLRPIFTDNEIDTATAVTLRNRGVPDAIISPASADVEIDAASLERFKALLETKTTGDNRGRPFISNLPVNVDRIALVPAELASEETKERATKRICSAFGIHPAAIGLASAGKGAQYGALMTEARESSYEQCILPLLAEIAEAATYQLLPDFAWYKPTLRSARRRGWLMRRKWVSKAAAKPAADPGDLRVNFDYSEVRDLQENADAVSTRAVAKFKGGLTTLDEGREEIGLRPAQDGEIGGKFWWQLASAGSNGGEFGVAPAADDEQTPPQPTEPDPDPDDEDLPEEDDEEE